MKAVEDSTRSLQQAKAYFAELKQIIRNSSASSGGSSNDELRYDKIFNLACKHLDQALAINKHKEKQ